MSDRHTRDWYQQSLVPSDVTEITIKIGLVPATGHGQWWAEIKDPTNEVLLGMASCPHFEHRHLPEELKRAVTKAVQLHDATIEPF